MGCRKRKVLDDAGAKSTAELANKLAFQAIFPRFALRAQSARGVGDFINLAAVRISMRAIADFDPI